MTITMGKHSDITALVIQQEDSTTLITETAKYCFFSGKVVRVEPVTDYKSAIETEMDMLKEEALGGFGSKEYFLQIFGQKGVPSE